jgi:CheY-like chemotaxis protein
MPIKTTLVVDDSKSARIMLSRMLQKLGLEVQMVESGEEAIAFMDNNPAPDVVFMDHMMPGLDGVQACKAISSKHSVPIFMYTSKEGPEYESEAQAAGAVGLLGKPAQMERLERIVDELSAQADSPVQTPASEEPVSSQETPDLAEVSTSSDDIPTLEPTQVEVTVSHTPSAPSTPQPEAPAREPAMSREVIEQVATPLIEEQFKTLIDPISQSVQDLKAGISDNQSEIRKLVSRQANATNMVTQPVLDASIKQTSTQFQNQLTNEVKSLRELIERATELSPSDLDQIKEIAIKSGAIAGSEQGEKAATSAAEAVAAKVSAAQAQIQVQQDIAPLLKKVKTASMISVISIVIAAASLGAAFVL